MNFSDGNLKSSDVYFIKAPVELEKIRAMLETLSLPFTEPRKLIGIKLHWGEENNTTYIPPYYILPIIDYIRKKEAMPFITDSLTLYTGKRRDGVSSLMLAYKHGFYFHDAPVIIADGLRGENRFVHKIIGKHFSEVELCGVLSEADGFIVVSHFKGHLEAGFGGAIKNISMGFASRRQKQLMHADVTPFIKEERCTGCGRCVRICPVQAIELVNKIARFDLKRCIGCASCIAVCPADALKLQWAHDVTVFIERLVEGARGAYEFLKGRSLFINFLINITPECDCMPYEQEVIVEDIGVLASLDPVAIDSLSIELFNNAPPKTGSSKEKILSSTKDKLKALYPDIPYWKQISYAETLGLGTTNFKRIDL